MQVLRHSEGLYSQLLRASFSEFVVAERVTGRMGGRARSRKPVMNGVTFNADFYNAGHAIQVQPVDHASYLGTTKLGQDIYPLLRVHLHTPKEHTGESIACSYFSLEDDIVHDTRSVDDMIEHVLSTTGEHRRIRLCVDVCLKTRMKSHLEL
jgi:hypothetical protein